MKSIGTLIVLLISIHAFGQNLIECGKDNNPKLTPIESEFLDSYMSEEKKKGIDFSEKRVLFITGNNASKKGTKSEYFEHIKRWNEIDVKIATWVVDLNDEEQEKLNSAGYDVIVSYWVKLLTNRRKRKILNSLE